MTLALDTHFPDATVPTAPVQGRLMRRPRFGPLWGDRGFRWLWIDQINIASLGQAITPDHILGRASSGTSVLSAAALIVGTVVGGLVGTQLGLREAIWLSAIGHLVPLAIILRSPISRIRVLPPVSTAVPITT